MKISLFAFVMMLCMTASGQTNTLPDSPATYVSFSPYITYSSRTDTVHCWVTFSPRPKNARMAQVLCIEAYSVANGYLDMDKKPLFRKGWLKNPKIIAITY